MQAKVWVEPGIGGWHFVTVPQKESAEIKDRFGILAGGWGSLPVLATIGETTWKTSVFPDKRVMAYILPLKADVRKKELIFEGDEINFTIEIAIG